MKIAEVLPAAPADLPGALRFGVARSGFQAVEGRVLITNDGATILKQMEVIHPSAHLLGVGAADLHQTFIFINAEAAIGNKAYFQIKDIEVRLDRIVVELTVFKGLL